MMIPLLRPSCTNAEIEAVTTVLKSGWWGQGPAVEQFEKELALLHQYAYCVTTNSATAALHLALLANGIGPGDEVVLPALTFISSALAVLYCGATPIFADVCSDTLCLDLQDARAKTTGATKAYLPVDYSGRPALMETHLPRVVIQDAAHACGGVGYGDTMCLSFHPVKPLGTGDGGAILTNDPEQAQRLRSLRWCGIDRSTWERSKAAHGWDYTVSEVGYKYHWNDIQAAIGLAQLHRLDEMRQERQRLARRYRKLLAGHDLQLPEDVPEHIWHLFVIRVPTGRRDGLITALTMRGISAGVHYKPLTLYPLFAQETPPVTAREWKRLVTLPLYYGLTDDEQDYICKEVVRYLEGGDG
jgi:perosamine synthetase